MFVVPIKEKIEDVSEGKLTPEKEYEVFLENDDFFYIINNFGLKEAFFKYRFKQAEHTCSNCISRHCNTCVHNK